MKTIFKQILGIADGQEVTMPEGAKILHLGKQKGVPTIWYECDPEKTPVEVVVRCFGTGYSMPDDMSGMEYIGTVITYNDMGVWHYYVEVKK